MALPIPINRTPAWLGLKLHALARKVSPLSLKKAFKDKNRAKEMSVRTEHVTYDYSRQLVSGTTMDLLFGLAKAAGLKAKIEAMFRGEKINRTEERAALHTALRQQSDEPVYVDGKDVISEVKDVLTKVKTFSEEVHDGTRKGVTGKKIKNIIAIGIGGSYLGPEYLAEACKVYAKEGMTLRFVANVDGTDFAEKTKDLNAEETMFVIISKTFTTAETMMNAKTAQKWTIEEVLDALTMEEAEKAKKWLKDELEDAPDAIRKHFVAVSTAKDKVEAFGIDSNNMFGFWDWVGGRYSATSAVGAVPLSLFLGFNKFEEILKGANWMDNHFRNTPFEQNIPVISALIDIWNINFLGHRIRALLPYCQALSKLPAHTQQVEMESNGKRVDLYGRLVKFATGEAVFGEPGTNGQHSFYQLIHQGMIIPADFIGFNKPQHPKGERNPETGEVTHHDELMTNFFAQPDALAFGKQDAENPAKVFPGNRPSSSLLLEKLTPFTAGLLLAWTEHRTAVKGFVWGLNSFDQFGVELGKALGKAIRALMLKFFAERNLDFAGLNESTKDLLRAYLTGKLPT